MRGLNRGFAHEMNHPVVYRWRLDDDEACVNDWLGRRVRIAHLGERRCVACGRRVKKLYQNGYCFPCVTSLAETDLCIVKPHECHFHLGTCRDNSFAQTQCNVPHYVYLGVSSHAKVGLTRKNREWIRWIDQGAVRAGILAELPARKMAGELEMEIAQGLPDKTDWRKLVTGQKTEIDLAGLAGDVRRRLSAKWSPYLLDNFITHEFTYPAIPDRVPPAKAFDLSEAAVEGTCIGVRGQYLLLDNGVVNVRKHAGMLLDVQVT